jgi:hypothetical protein
MVSRFCDRLACVRRLDRLARSTRDLLNILDVIAKAGAGGCRALLCCVAVNYFSVVAHDHIWLAALAEEPIELAGDPDA